MTDKELIELAAKAARMEINLERQFERNELGFGHVGLWIVNGSTRWNPLTYDCDAFRLAVKLNLLYGKVFSRSVAEYHEDGDDIYAATRRAITRAAAQIGKEME